MHMVIRVLKTTLDSFGINQDGLYILDMNTFEDFTNAKSCRFKVPKFLYFIQDSDNVNAGYGKDRYFSYTWDTFLIIYHQY